MKPGVHNTRSSTPNPKVTQNDSATRPLTATVTTTAATLTNATPLRAAAKAAAGAITAAIVAWERGHSGETEQRQAIDTDEINARKMLQAESDDILKKAQLKDSTRVNQAVVEESKKVARNNISRLYMATQEFHDNIVNVDGRKVHNNTFLSIYNLHKNLNGLNIDVSFDPNTHIIVFSHEGQILCGQYLDDPDHQDLLLELCQRAGSPLTLSNIVDQLNLLFNSGSEDYTNDLGGKTQKYNLTHNDDTKSQWYVSRSPNGTIVQCMKVPQIAVTGGGAGASRKVDGADYATIAIHKTTEHIERQANPLTRVESLSNEEMAELVETAHDSFITHPLQSSDNAWVMNLGARVTNTTSGISQFQGAAIALSAVHRNGAVHMDIKLENMLWYLKRRTFANNAMNSGLEYTYKMHTSAQDESDLDHNIDIHLIKDGTNLPQLHVKSSDGKFKLIPLSPDNPLEHRFLQTLKQIKTESDLNYLIWRNKRFLVTRGLFPSDLFAAVISDWWHAVPTLPKNFAQLSLQQQMENMVERAQKCHETFHTKGYSVELLKNILEAKIREMNKAHKNSEKEQEHMIKLADEIIKIAQLADNFAFLLTLLKTQGYEWNDQMANNNTSYLRIGLPGWENTDPGYSAPSVGSRMFKDDFSVPDVNNSSKVSQFTLNMYILKSFIVTYIKPEHRALTFDLLTNPSSLIANNQNIPEVTDMIDWEASQQELSLEQYIKTQISERFPNLNIAYLLHPGDFDHTLVNEHLNYVFEATLQEFPPKYSSEAAIPNKNVLLDIDDLSNAILIALEESGCVTKTDLEFLQNSAGRNVIFPAGQGEIINLNSSFVTNDNNGLFLGSIFNNPDTEVPQDGPASEIPLVSSHLGVEVTMVQSKITEKSSRTEARNTEQTAVAAAASNRRSNLAEYPTNSNHGVGLGGLAVRHLQKAASSADSTANSNPDGNGLQYDDTSLVSAAAAQHTSTRNKPSSPAIQVPYLPFINPFAPIQFVEVSPSA